jgi:hypothetical protein
LGQVDELVVVPGSNQAQTGVASGGVAKEFHAVSKTSKKVAPQGCDG